MFGLTITRKTPTVDHVVSLDVAVDAVHRMVALGNSLPEAVAAVISVLPEANYAILVSEFSRQEERRLAAMARNSR